MSERTITQQQRDQQIIARYTAEDDAFRAAKKRGDFRRASEHKAQRDALSAALTDAHRRQREGY